MLTLAKFGVLVIAAIVILLGVVVFVRKLRFKANALQVDARLVKSEEIGDLREDGRIAVRLLYEYRNSDGHTIQGVRKSLRWKIPPVGSHRTMLVDPAQPTCLRLPGIRDYLVASAIVAIGSIIMITVALQV